MPTELPRSEPHSPPHLSVVVPAFNEEARISATLSRTLEFLDQAPYSWELLVVDDGSTDGTVQVALEAIAGRANAEILTYDTNRGKGYAVRHGVLKAKGNYVLFCDADFATPIHEVNHLFSAIQCGADIAIGSRDVAGAKLEVRQSWLRETGGKIFNQCVQRAGVPGIHDTQCGFKLFTGAAASQVFTQCHIDNFSFDVEVLYIALIMGYKIAEVPVVWSHQEGSKVRFVRDALRMVKTLFHIRAIHAELVSAYRNRSSAP